MTLDRSPRLDRPSVRLALCAVALGSACAGGALAVSMRAARPGAPGGAPAAAGLGPALRAAMEQVHFAFRAEGGAFRGGHATYEVAVADGALAFTPWHHPGGGREAVEGRRILLGPARLARGGAPLAEGPGVAATNARAELELAKGPAVERLANGPGGLEQTWTFAARPAGRGDLEVRLPLLEGRLLAATETGLHLGAGRLGARYGHGTWVDAAGRRAPVPARFEAGAIVLAVPGAVVDGAAYPAVLDPVVAPEVALDEPVYGPDGAGHWNPKLSFDGTNHLVVWLDLRGGAGNVYGARVSPAGAVLDPAGLAICTHPAGQGHPAVAWDGTNHLVVWEDYRSGGSADLYGARVSAAGVVLDTAGVAVTTAAGVQGQPALAWDGTNHLVVWTDQRSGEQDVYGARVTAAGVVLDPAGIPISTAAGNQSGPSVSWNGASHLVTWTDFRGGAAADVYGARVSAAGVVQDPGGLAISTAAGSQYEPAVAWDGTNHLVVWKDEQAGPRTGIFGARVSSAGAVLDVDAVALSTVTPAGEPSLAWGGSEYLVAWGCGPGICGARVSGAGAVLDPGGIAITSAAGTQLYPAVSWDGTRFLVAWGDDRGGVDYDIYGARVSAAGVVEDPAGVVLATVANRETAPAASWDGASHLVVWQDRRAGGWDVRGVRLSAAGAVRDPAGIAVSTAAGDQVAPAVAWDGTHHLVVWQDGRPGAPGIYGARVSAAGAVQDPAGLPVAAPAPSAQSPAVAWNGTTHLVVWSDGRGGTLDVYGARVTPAGAVLDASGVAISAAAGDQTSPAVSWNGTSHLVAWTDARGGTPDVYGARVTAAGAVLDPAGAALSARAGVQSAPAVAWNGTNHLVVFQDDLDVSGTWVTPAGTVHDPFVVSTAVGSQAAPAVAWDGSTHLVAWEDAGRGGRDVLAARVSGAGAVLDPGGFTVSEGDPAGAPRQAVLSASGPGQILVAYVTRDAAPAVQAERIRARVVGLGAPAGGGGGAGAGPDAGAGAKGGGCSTGGGAATLFGALALLALRRPRDRERKGRPAVGRASRASGAALRSGYRVLNVEV